MAVFEGSARGSIAMSGSTAPRDLRVTENHLTLARGLVESMAGLTGSVDDLRQRLLGLAEPPTPVTASKEPQLVRAELSELTNILERLSAMMQTHSSKLADLHSI